MHRQQAADRRFSSQQLPALLQIDLAKVIDIDEYRHGPDAHDGQGGGERAQWRRDDFIVRTDAEGAQADFQRLQAIADPDRVLDSQVTGETLLKSLDFLAEK